MSDIASTGFNDSVTVRIVIQLVDSCTARSDTLCGLANIHMVAYPALESSTTGWWLPPLPSSSLLGVPVAASSSSLRVMVATAVIIVDI